MPAAPPRPRRIRRFATPVPRAVQLQEFCETLRDLLRKCDAALASEVRRAVRPLTTSSRATSSAIVMGVESRRRWSQAGALTAAGTSAAAIFCCLPFAVGAFGAGLAAFGARFAPFRAYLSLSSVALLGYAFYAAYHRPDVSCDDGSCATTPDGARRRRAVVWIVAAVVAVLLTAGWWANWAIYWTL